MKNDVIKILFVTNMRPSIQKPYSGIFVHNQYKRIKEDDEFHIEIFSMERTFTNKLGSIIKYLKAFWSFFPYIKSGGHDVIHLHYYFPLIIPVAIYKLIHRRTMVVATFHGSDVNERLTIMNSWFFRIFNNAIDFVISVGKDLSNMVYKKLHLNSDLIMSAGVDERTFYYKEGAIKKYDFVFAASFIKRKGLDLLIQAIKDLDRQDVSYCFIGSGKLESEINGLASKYQVEVKLNLCQAEMCDVFNQTFFHLLPSRFEPFGLVVTESMYCGVPSIVTPVGGLKDQIVDGENGWVMSKISSDDIVCAIQSALEVKDKEEYAIMRANCLKANKEYSLEHVISQTKLIYKDLLFQNNAGQIK